MKHFSLKTRNWLIEFDADYGCNHRRGWSLAYQGHYIIAFSPLPSVVKCWWNYKPEHDEAP